MIKAVLHKKSYDDLKTTIITDIYFLIKVNCCNDMTLNIMEKPGIPSIVTQTFDEQESETIDEIVIEGNNIIARASCGGYDIESEYNLDKFEIPMLIEILDSVEKHIDLEPFDDSEERRDFGNDDDDL
jgi:hypothetical protein